MAQTDLTGLLTGVGSSPISPMSGMTREARMAQRAQGFSDRMTRGMLSVAGKDPRTLGQQAQAALAELDPSKKEDRVQILDIVSRVNPERVPMLKERFAAEDKKETLAAASLTSSTETRKSVSEQIRATHPDLADAVINERASGNTSALDAALGIIRDRSKPTTPATGKIVNLVDTQTDKTVGTALERNGQLYLQNPDGTTSSTPMTPEELENRGISASYVKPAAPVVTIEKPTPAEIADAERRGKLFEPLNTVAAFTQEKALTAVDTKQNALSILSQVERDANTGTIQGMTSDLVKFAQSAYQLAGMPVPASITDKMSSKAFYQKLAADGLLPRIAEQGRGFTDTERTFFLNEVLPSYNQTFQFNELAGNMQLVEAQMDIEENGFAQARRAHYVGTDTPPTGTHAEAFSNYLERLPMAKFEKHTRRVSGEDVTYDRMVALQDNAKLYQYWAGGEAPRGFTLPITNPKTKLVENTDLSWAQINALAKKKETTPRQLLAQAQRNGHLIKAVY